MHPDDWASDCGTLSPVAAKLTVLEADDDDDAVRTRLLGREDAEHDAADDAQVDANEDDEDADAEEEEEKARTGDVMGRGRVGSGVVVAGGGRVATSVKWRGGDDDDDGAGGGGGGSGCGGDDGVVGAWVVVTDCGWR